MGGMNETQKSWASSPATRRSMKGNKARDTSAELSVRRLLHARGLRYRVNYRPLGELRRTVDIAFTRQKIAVFLDGCSAWLSYSLHTSDRQSGVLEREGGAEQGERRGHRSRPASDRLDRTAIL
jgi:DNA mismatch endonuclease Vsr